MGHNTRRFVVAVCGSAHPRALALQSDVRAGTGPLARSLARGRPCRRQSVPPGASLWSMSKLGLSRSQCRVPAGGGGVGLVRPNQLRGGEGGGCGRQPVGLGFTCGRQGEPSRLLAPATAPRSAAARPFVCRTRPPSFSFLAAERRASIVQVEQLSYRTHATPAPSTRGTARRLCRAAQASPCLRTLSPSCSSKHE